MSTVNCHILQSQASGYSFDLFEGPHTIVHISVRLSMAVPLPEECLHQIVFHNPITRQVSLWLPVTHVARAEGFMPRIVDT